MLGIFEDFMDRVTDLPDAEVTVDDETEKPSLRADVYDNLINAYIVAKQVDVKRIQRTLDTLERLADHYDIDCPPVIVSTNDFDLSQKSERIEYDPEQVTYVDNKTLLFGVQLKNPIMECRPTDKKAVAKALCKIVRFLADMNNVFESTMKSAVAMYHMHWSQRTGHYIYRGPRAEWIQLLPKIVYPDSTISVKEIKDIIGECDGKLWALFYPDTSYGKLESVTKVLKKFAEERVDKRHDTIYNRR